MDARRRRFPRESRPWLRARRHPDARLALRSRTLADVAASALRVPRIAALLAAGAAIGPHALGLLELPPDSLGAQLLLTLGVSFILFHGGAELSLPVLRSVALGLGCSPSRGFSSPPSSRER